MMFGRRYLVQMLKASCVLIVATVITTRDTCLNTWNQSTWLPVATRVLLSLVTSFVDPWMPWEPTQSDIMEHPVPESFKICRFCILDLESSINEKLYRDEGNILRCKLCDYQSNKSSNARHHVESKHLSLQYFCQYCDTVCPTKNALQVHIQRKHKHWMKEYHWSYLDVDSHLTDYMQKDEAGLWACLSCDFKTPIKTNMKQHLESKHISVTYKCSYCPKECSTKDALRKHTIRNHKA